jgi:uncharacterized membrane protein
MGQSEDRGVEMQTEGEQDRRPVWRRVLAAPEGKVLAAGVVVLLWYVTTVAFTWLLSPEFCRSLVNMTVAHLLGGRAAGMSIGYGSNLSRGVVIVANMAIETFLVLLFYPLFVFSYQRLFVIEPLEDAIRRAREAAQTHQRTILKFGVPGLLLFVWFPFWMTGPLVGCVIGFLIGLHPVVNLIVVLLGTYLAIFCWGVILHRFYEWVAPWGPYVPFAIVATILLVAVAIHVRYAFFHRRSDDGDGPGEGAAGGDAAASQ